MPLHPALVKILRWHLEQPGWTSFDGHLFVGPRGGLLRGAWYRQVFHEARARAFTRREAASSLATRPYDLRHAAVSTWLSAGVPSPQVAEWADHSVVVLHKVYAKVITGGQDKAKKRISDLIERQGG